MGKSSHLLPFRVGYKYTNVPFTIPQALCGRVRTSRSACHVHARDNRRDIFANHKEKLI